MNKDHSAILDAALDVFMRYGFKRATMGDIAQAAGMSRQSLYARFTNKDEVYAAGLLLFSARTIEKLEAEWAKSDDVGHAMDALANISVIPVFEMLRATPDATDLIEAAASESGRAAMAEATQMKRSALAKRFGPFADVLTARGLTPDQLADFVETSKHSIVQNAVDRAHLDAQLATLKASVIALTHP